MHDFKRLDVYQRALMYTNWMKSFLWSSVFAVC